MQTFVVGAAVVDIALVVDVQGFDKEGYWAVLGLRQIALSQLLADLKELYSDGVFAHHQAPQVVA